MPLFSIVNLIIFQAAWFSAALLKDDSVFILLFLLGLHWFWSHEKRLDFCVMVLVIPIGIVSELLMVFSGLISYQSSLMLPVWMVLLWCHLSVSLNHSLAWMQKVPWIWQSLLAALAGTGSYAAATNLGAISLQHSQVLSLLIIAVVWGIQFPFMMGVVTRVKQGKLACSALK